MNGVSTTKKLSKPNSTLAHLPGPPTGGRTAATATVVSEQTSKVTDIRKYGFERKKPAPPNRNVSVRLSGEALHIFERLEKEIGVKAATVMKDGLWLAAFVADELLSGRQYDLVLQPREGVDASRVDLLERGPLFIVDSVNDYKAGVLPASAPTATADELKQN